MILDSSVARSKANLSIAWRQVHVWRNQSSGPWHAPELKQENNLYEHCDAKRESVSPTCAEMSMNYYPVSFEIGSKW